MSVEAFSKDDSVKLNNQYSDGNKCFGVGDRGKVCGHDGPLVIVCIPPKSGYRISVRPALLKPVSKN